MAGIGFAREYEATKGRNYGGLFAYFTCFGVVPRPLKLLKTSGVLGEDDDISLFM